MLYVFVSRPEWEKPRQRQSSISSGEGAYPQDGTDEEVYLYHRDSLAHKTNGRFPYTEAQVRPPIALRTIFETYLINCY